MLLLVTVVGCKCKPDVVDPVKLGFRVQPASLDFGRVLEGDRKTLSVTLSATSTVTETITVTTTTAFSSVSEVELPGGGQVPLEVSFFAGNVEVDGTLTLTVGDQSTEIPLHGIGVRPPVCTPSKECVSSMYDLESDQCIETPLADGSDCQPSSVCLTGGQCHGGECLGVPRSCDDGNPCTDDACQEDAGCYNPPHVCPAPSEPCQVATCDVHTGCGQGPATNGVFCGPFDCVQFSACLQGACVVQETPDGTPCGAAIACLPEATCENDVCTRAIEGTWTPQWSTPLAAPLDGALAALGSNVYFSFCQPLEDGGSSCALSSFTGGGFERYTLPYDDGARRELLGVSNAGVLLAADGGFELRGTTASALMLDVLPPGPWALGSDMVLISFDGGVSMWTQADAGLRWLTDAQGTLALGDALFVWNADAGLLSRVGLLEDGGVDRRDVMLEGAGEELVTSDTYAVFPGFGDVWFELDGGTTVQRFDAGAVLANETLAARGVMNVFDVRCFGDEDAGIDAGCGTWVRGFSLSTTDQLFEGPITNGALLATTTIEPGLGVFGALIREDGGAHFKLYVDGQESGVCHLPLESSDVQNVTFSSSAMVTTRLREDGGVVLESYDLESLPIGSFGWTTPSGLNGRHADR